MVIALLPSAFHPSLGGVEELTRQLAHELQKRDHKTVILTNRWPRTLPAFERFEGLDLYRIPFRMPEPMWKAQLSYWLTGWWMMRRVVAILRKHEVELLHVQCVSSNAHYALEAGKSLGLPVVVTLQGELTMDASQVFQRSSLARQTFRSAMREAAVITACSAKTLSDAETYSQISTKCRGKVIFNAARSADFSQVSGYQHGRPYLFALGRIVPQKGFDILLRALAISQCNRDLIIAGDGEELPRLQALCEELGLRKRVRFVGRADRNAVAAYFQGCDFVVVPSVADEGLPVVCAEALAAGRAVVSTDTGGAPEVILHGVCGLVVPKGDVSALAKAIDRMSADDEFRHRASAACQDRARFFDWKTITDQYEAIYESARAGAEMRLGGLKSCTSG